MTTTGRPNTRPPRWAEAVLRLLLRPEDRDSVSGDLLEEYRDTILPARGKRADRWYVRQVGWFLLRACWVPGILIGGALVIRYLFDTLVPVTNYVQRSTIMSQAIMAICLLAAFRMSLRTRSVRAGLLTSVVAGGLGGLVSIAGSAVMLAVWPDRAGLLDGWRNTGGIDEVFLVVPLIMVVVGVIMGTVGALAGKIVAWPMARMRRQA